MRSLLKRIATACGDVGSSISTGAHLALDFSLQPCSFPTRRGDRLVVLGSGPSLRQTLAADMPPFTTDTVFMSVNDFYQDESFHVLQPGLHVIADSSYWDESSYERFAAPLVVALQAAIWDITLFLPTRARASRLHRALIDAKVQVVFYRMTPIKGMAALEYLAFRARLGMPKAQNVLVAALAIGLWMEFRTIILVGADHTWHRDLSLSDQNMLLLTHLHSYGAAGQRPFLKPSAIAKSVSGQVLERADLFSVREIFLAWATAHESYEKLARIASRQGVRIVNCSAVTFIDAFERADFATTVARSDRGAGTAIGEKSG